jgi:hypothetical protein
LEFGCLGPKAQPESAGKDYIKLDRTAPTDTEAGKIELIEFFGTAALTAMRLSLPLQNGSKTRPKMWWYAAFPLPSAMTSHPSVVSSPWKPWAC